MHDQLPYKLVRPDSSLSDFVDSFWMLRNDQDTGKDIVVLPDGKLDLFFSTSNDEPFHVTLSGLETQPDKAKLGGKTVMFAISFKLLATEYILHNTIAGLIDTAIHLKPGFWDFTADDLQDFDAFCGKASAKISSLMPVEIDNRKQDLFNLIYSTNGSMSVKDLAAKVFWSPRQINRYFTQQFGISLKAYCNILRFRASFMHIRDGKLFPQENFADQSHFIKQVKRLSGVSPKELKRNKDDRFIQFSFLPPE